MLLPEPLAPTTATNSPRSTSRSTPRSTGTSILALPVALRQTTVAERWPAIVIHPPWIVKRIGSDSDRRDWRTGQWSLIRTAAT